MAGVIALGRTGMRVFWSTDELIVPRLRVNEAGPVIVLLAACTALTIWAGPAMTYLDNTAQSLSEPASYIQAVLRSDEHTSELQSLMRTPYAVFSLQKKKHNNQH